MALLTKIKLTPNYDWKSILLEDITGTGITGYGSNQSPAGYREFSNIDSIRVELTSPSLVTTSIDIDGAELITFQTTLQYTITSIVLGYSIDESIEEGIWTVNYTPFFSNDITVGLTATTPNTSLTYLTVNKSFFTNATKLQTVSGGIYSNILSNNIGTTTSILSTNAVQISLAGDEYYVGLGTTLCTPISKSIKECLDNKIADITNCECKDVDCELVNKYLLYDAMFVNCKEGNPTKAQQIFDLLTIYCTNNCGC